MGHLEGRVALVTGAARGIGLAAARKLIEAGADVLLTDVNADQGGAAARALGPKAAFFSHDVTDEAQWAAAVAEAQSRFGGLDILVNNAGVFWIKPIFETALEDFRRMQAINVEGVFLGLKHAGPAIAARAQRWSGGGAIVNLSSVAGLRGAALASAYNASKGAVRLMTKGAALELAALKVRVNSVHPAIIDTTMGRQLVTDFAATGLMGGVNDVETRLKERHPLGRFGHEDDVANTIVFLASDAAAFMTGSELVVDGGLSAQ